MVFTRSLAGLVHIVENGILIMIHFVSYQEERVQNIVMEPPNMEKVVCTGLRIKQFVIKAVPGLLKIAIVDLTKTIILDHTVMNGVLDMVLIVCYQVG